MPTLCIHCALRALVEGEVPGAVEDTPEAHLARVHPDPEATRRERADLERRAADLCRKDA